MYEPFQTILSKTLPFVRERSSHVTVYPRSIDCFNAYKLTPPSEVKVVILGQDPYHDGSAHGLSFSTLGKVTPSLRVIFKEMASNGFPRTNPNLTDWAKQGVLLLNSVLTVEKGSPGSHRNKGWEILTAATLQYLYLSAQPVVFMLWGRDAQTTFTNATRGLEGSAIANRTIAIAHPQAENYSGGKAGFYGSQCFELANQFLIEHEVQQIQWSEDNQFKHSL